MVELAERAGRHNLLVLAAGLAFFGLISFGPAVAVGFGLLEIVASSDATDEIVDLLEDGITTQFGLVDLLKEMEDQGGRYAGIGFLVLLWPATTLASGWARALNDVDEVDAGGPSGIKGRLRGLVPGAVLVAGLFGLFAAVTFGAAFLGDDGALLAVLLFGGAIVLGLWLYVVNTALLLGAELNAMRRERADG